MQLSSVKIEDKQTQWPVVSLQTSTRFLLATSTYHQDKLIVDPVVSWFYQILKKILYFSTLN